MSAFSRKPRCAKSLRNSALTANKMRRTLISSLAAEIFQVRPLRDLTMANEKELSAYRILDPKSLLALVADLKDVRALLGDRTEDWRIREVGDGNLNLVFIVDGPDGSVCVKQALPYVRAAGPSWPMSPERAFFENSYYIAVAPYVGASIPRIYHYDSELYCTVMERLSPHIILRHGLIQGLPYDNLAPDIAQYISPACSFTSAFARPSKRRIHV